ncbi:MAG: YbaK/EbsC family protein, partial [Sphaerochaetaceae bacterium]|nr:YbaK/EbsC family protein [Sphaerochaetaceae bacterium]
MQVCKTIVTRGSDDLIRVFCLPGPLEISMKKARACLQVSSLELVDQRDLRKLSGYIRGGVSPLGMIRPYPLYLEETMQLYDQVAISAGQRGVQLFLCPTDLQRVTGGNWADFA